METHCALIWTKCWQQHMVKGSYHNCKLYDLSSTCEFNSIFNTGVMLTNLNSVFSILPSIYMPSWVQWPDAPLDKVVLLWCTRTLSLPCSKLLQTLLPSSNKIAVTSTPITWLPQPLASQPFLPAIQSNMPILVTLGPDTFGLNKEVVAIQMTLINRPAELFNIIDHIIQVSIKISL